MEDHCHNVPDMGNSDRCDKCLSLFGTRDGLHSVCTEAGYLHWSSKSDLYTKSEICKLCRLVWQSRSWRSTKVVEPLYTCAPKTDVAEPFLAQSAILGYDSTRLSTGRLEVRDSSGKTLVRLYLTALAGEQVPKLYKYLISSAYTVLEDLASTIIHTRPVRATVDDDRTVQQVQHWLSTCQQSHPYCAKSPSSWLPLRLIDVALDKFCSNIRLRSTTSLNGIYVALSYCWGDLQQPATTTQNIAQREAGISPKVLPQTIQDAILFTRRLGIRYLWVDAICIIQNDEDDRRTQIKLMGQIYKNAFLTIAASTSVAVREGFLQMRCKPDCSVDFPLFITQHSHGTINIATWKFYNPWDEPLHRRCWSFQELALSRRMLVFSKYEVLWRCSTEQMLATEKSHIAYHNFSALPRQVFGSRIHTSTSLQKQQREIWPRVVVEYSKRRVTHLLDRVSALVGVATELSTAWRDTYILGLWSRVLVQNLAWRVAAQQVIGTQRVSDNLPSWSWLSIKDRVEMWPVLRDSDAEIIQPSGGFRQVLTVEDLTQKCIILHLRARAISATSVLQHPLVTSTRLQKLGTFRYMIDLDLNEHEAENAHILIVLLGHVMSKCPSSLCLLLRRFVPQGSTIVWQRIGRIRVWNHDWNTTSYSSLLIT